MTNEDELHKKMTQEIERLEYFSSNLNRETFGLLDEAKHLLLIVIRHNLSKKVTEQINYADANKLLAGRSDVLTLEFILMVIDKFFPGYMESSKNKLLEALNSESKKRLFKGDSVPKLARWTVPADVLLDALERQGDAVLTNLLDVKKLG